MEIPDDRVIRDLDDLDRFIILDNESKLIDIDLSRTNYVYVFLPTLYEYIVNIFSRREMMGLKSPISHYNQIFYLEDNWNFTERAKKTLTGGFYRRKN